MDKNGNKQADKFVVVKRNGAGKALRGISLWNTTYELAAEMSDRAGISMVELIDKALRFCNARMEIREEDA